LLDTLAAVSAVPDTQPILALSGELWEAEEAIELTRVLQDIPVIRQRGTTLGQRIAAAHADAAERFPGSAVLQIGMDTPQIGPRLLDDCCRALASPGTDAVLGRATDGGWWALGLQDPLAAASIASVPTSRDNTGELTAQALRAHGLRVAELPELSDVDTAADAWEVAESLPGSRFAAAVEELR